MRLAGAFLAILPFLPTPAAAQTGADVLLVVNQRSGISRRIGDYYIKKREVPLTQVCRLNLTPDEEISRDVFNDSIQKPIAAFLKQNQLVEKILYIVTTSGVPLKIAGTMAELQSEASSVDSELAALYGRNHGLDYPFRGALKNPYYMRVSEPFSHPRFPLYLVARLAGYSFEDVQGLIDRSLVAKNTGMLVLDARADNNTPGNEWLRAAARALPRERVILEETSKVLYDQKNVIGYASWGSNDPDRHRRDLGFEWLPGAISTEYVSTNARTFSRPPDSWNIGSWKDSPATWFANSPQTLTADMVQGGATGASGHVYEPYLELNPRPDYLFPAYFSGRTLGESYYISMPAISWMNVVIGDPLCRLR
jgi:uncharacterized protein (TIGR03790 family)